MNIQTKHKEHLEELASDFQELFWEVAKQIDIHPTYKFGERFGDVTKMVIKNLLALTNLIFVTEQTGENPTHSEHGCKTLTTSMTSMIVLSIILSVMDCEFGEVLTDDTRELIKKVDFHINKIKTLLTLSALLEKNRKEEANA